MRELLNNNSLFVSVSCTKINDSIIHCLEVKTKEDQSLRARDLTFFTTDFQTMNYSTTIHC